MLDRAAKPAELQYRSGDFIVVKPGSFVLCAVSGIRIELDELRYWSADRQEAYSTAAIALSRLGNAKTP